VTDLPHKLPLPETQALPRCLGVVGTLFLTLSAASPASSVFIIVPGMLQSAGSGTLWAFLLASVVCVATAYVYAELSAAFPLTGGEYVMVGRTIGPLAGFIVLVINLISNVLFLPVVGLGVSAVLGTVLPGLPEVPTAIAVVVGSTLCAVFNIRVNALVTGIFLCVEMIALVVVVLLGLIHPANPILPILTHPTMLVDGALVPTSLPAIGLATTVAIFALNGYGMAVYFGEEMHEPERRIAKIVLLSFVLTFVLEVAPLVALLVGASDLKAMYAADDPFGLFILAYGGGGLASIVAVGVAVAIVNAAIVTILAAARFFWSTGRDRTWGPRWDALVGHIHPRLQSPWIATVAMGFIGTLCCFVSLPFLLIVSGGGLIVTYAAIAIAALIGRHGGATAHGQYRMPLFPAAPIVTLIALVGVLYANWQDVEEGRPALFATAAQIALAAIYYWLVLRPRGWTANAATTS
jgi:amino acid transporter